MVMVPHRILEALVKQNNKAKQKKVGRKKEAFNIYLEPEQLVKLKALAKDPGIPIAVQVRKAIDQYLKTA